MECYGYAHITYIEAKENLIDLEALAKRKKWDLNKGSLISTFSVDIPKTGLEFGKRPSAKELRNMKKELLKTLDIK